MSILHSPSLLLSENLLFHFSTRELYQMTALLYHYNAPAVLFAHASSRRNAENVVPAE